MKLFSVSIKIKNHKYILEYSLIFISFFIGFISHAQTPTIGLRFIDPNVSDGYTLFTPEKNNSVYLINNCGEKVNEWTFTELPGATCYLLENGTLLRAGKQALEIRDWSNNVIWSYLLETIGLGQHHDIEPLPNGNILTVISDFYSQDAITSEGRNPATTTLQNFKLDKIVEIHPIGSNDASVVWEWKFKDHLIQDFDNTKSNYGVVIDHPELIDINFDNNQNKDYTHVNAVDYNAALDQILISSRHLSEIYIIDHSTTTAEAAGHTGGNSNIGGDLLWRWGNPQVYKQANNQKLFLQHDSKWVEPGYLDAGKVTVFNNDADGTGMFSSIVLITPDINNGIYIKGRNIFKPADYEWSWNGSFLGRIVQESKKSGTHQLPNGNFIISEAQIGQVSEITKSGTQLWTYKNPSGPSIINQFEDPILNNIFFRAEKYPSTYIGFTGKNMTPQGIIEDQNTLSSACAASLSVKKSELGVGLILNPIKNNTIQFVKNINFNSLNIIDLNGRTIYKHGPFNGNNLKINLIPGMYFVKLQFDNKIEILKIIIQH